MGQRCGAVFVRGENTEAVGVEVEQAMDGKIGVLGVEMEEECSCGDVRVPFGSYENPSTSFGSLPVVAGGKGAERGLGVVSFLCGL